MSLRTVLFVGSPNVGKSNYLFRLWLALRDGKHRRLKPSGTPEDLEYLNVGASAQLRGEYAQRTLGEVIERPNLPLLLDDAPVLLVAPDRPGEDWDKLYDERRWPSGWVDMITDQTGYLVFIPSTGSVQIPDWITVQALRGAKSNFRKAADLSTSAVPTQVVAVDWMQMLETAHRKVARWSPAASRPRIGLVITAWDKIEAKEPGLSPTAFLKREHRLLHDFLANGVGTVEYKIFATSLYGKDLNDPEFKASLRTGDTPPQAMGYVVTDCAEGPATSNDLALPAIWALGLD